jgi:hypothetical protein
MSAACCEHYIAVILRRSLLARCYAAALDAGRSLIGIDRPPQAKAAARPPGFRPPPSRNDALCDCRALPQAAARYGERAREPRR